MIRWTPESIERLAAIEGHVARDNPTAAERLVARLVERAESISQHPLMGRRVSEAQFDETLREVVEGNYRIVYRVAADGVVEILTVFEGHLGFERAPRRR